MKYNLLRNSYINSNTDVGNVSLSIENVEDLIDFTTMSGVVSINGTNDNIFCIDADLGDRVAIYQMRYYFDSATASGTVASGIEFYYKTDISNDYTALTTNIGAGCYYTTISQDYSAPRYVRIVHTVSGTSITGDVVAWSVLNDDSVVDFGSDGVLESTHINTSLSYLDYNYYIKEIEIYNSGAENANANMILEPQTSDVDYLMSISESENGPWVFSRNDDLVIVDGQLWDNGIYVDTNSDQESKLRLDAGKTSGTYTTQVFKKDLSKFVHIDINETVVSGAIIATDVDDYTSTIEIRSSHIKPEDYAVYRQCYNEGSYDRTLILRDYLISDGTKVFDSDVDLGVNYAADFEIDITYNTEYKVIVDNDTQKTFIFLRGATYDNYVYIIRIGPDMLRETYRLMGWHDDRKTLYLHSSFIKPWANGGIWMYFYSSAMNHPIDIKSDAARWYLINYDESFDNIYQYDSTSEFISQMDAVHSDGSLWYIATAGVNAIIKLDKDGNVLVTYDGANYTTDLKGLAALPDGGCWFTNDNSIYRLNSTGTLLPDYTIDNVSTSYSLNLVARDISDDNALWITDGTYVKRIFLDGRVDFSVDRSGVERMYPLDTGVWIQYTYVIDNVTYRHMAFIGIMSGSIERDVVCAAQYSTWKTQAASIIAYNNPTVGSNIPLATDSVWNSSLEWNKVSPNTYVFPNEEYHQLRLTLRRPDVGIDSPTVGAVYMQDSVQLTDIAPKQSKTLYLKIGIPEGITVNGEYSSMLKAWWEIFI